MKRLWLIVPALLMLILLRGVSVTGQTPNDQGSLVHAHVIRAIDGDTIELANHEVVRYIGINTPETVDPDIAEQCYGQQAHERNRELVAGKNVELMYGTGETYGRRLAYVYVNGNMVNGVLVREGYATVMTIPPNDQLATELERLAVLARSEGLGLWSVCYGD